ncbi:hypothetical protein MRX96_026882 [Rhipicephalus microplus]
MPRGARKRDRRKHAAGRASSALGPDEGRGFVRGGRRGLRGMHARWHASAAVTTRARVHSTVAAVGPARSHAPAEAIEGAPRRPCLNAPRPRRRKVAVRGVYTRHMRCCSVLEQWLCLAVHSAISGSPKKSRPISARPCDRTAGRPAPTLLLLLLFLGWPFTPYSIDAAAALLGLSAEPLISLAASLRGPEAQPRQCLDFSSYCSACFARRAGGKQVLLWQAAVLAGGPFLWPLRQVSGNAAGPLCCCCCGSRGAVASVHCRRSFCSRPALIAGGRGGALLRHGVLRVATPWAMQHFCAAAAIKVNNSSNSC